MQMVRKCACCLTVCNPARREKAMKSEDFSFSWIDLVILAVLVMGVIRGRKRGMSEELLDVLKWILIVATAGFVYGPLGGFLSDSTMFSHLSSYIATYTAIVILYMLVFSFIRRHIGGKLIGSDVFGNAEYYLGMAAGAVRYACITLVAMAFLNARYFSPGEVSAEIKYQQDNFGSIYFPTFCGIQHEVFAQSLTGRLTKDYLGVVLIKPTSPEEKGLGNAGLVRNREQNVFEVLDKK